MTSANIESIWRWITTRWRTYGWSWVTILKKYKNFSGRALQSQNYNNHLKTNRSLRCKPILAKIRSNQDKLTQSNKPILNQSSFMARRTKYYQGNRLPNQKFRLKIIMTVAVHCPYNLKAIKDKLLITLMFLEEVNGLEELGETPKRRESSSREFRSTGIKPS